MWLLPLRQRLLLLLLLLLLLSLLPLLLGHRSQLGQLGQFSLQRCLLGILLLAQAIARRGLVRRRHRRGGRGRQWVRCRASQSHLLFLLLRLLRLHLLCLRLLTQCE